MGSPVRHTGHRPAAQLQFHRSAPVPAEGSPWPPGFSPTPQEGDGSGTALYSWSTALYLASRRPSFASSIVHYTTLQGQSQKEGRLLAWRREALGGAPAGPVPGVARSVYVAWPSTINKRCWDISPHPVQHERDQQPAKRHLTRGEEEAARRGPHVSHLILCYRVSALGIVRFLNKMHHRFCHKPPRVDWRPSV